MYGAFEGDPTSSTQGGTVRILSLPSFTWLNSPVISSRARVGHACSLVGNRQLLSFGGQEIDIDPDTGARSAPPSDVWNNGIGIFDMTLLQWKDSYDPDAKPYEPPEMVKALYTSRSDLSQRSRFSVFGSVS
jgi:hypothetical protein